VRVRVNVRADASHGQDRLVEQKVLKVEDSYVPDSEKEQKRGDYSLPAVQKVA